MSEFERSESAEALNLNDGSNRSERPLAAPSTGTRTNKGVEEALKTGTSSSLDETLLLLNRVVHAAVTSIVVTDPHLPDNPIVFHNPAFERVSGYSASEIDGFNCRFLQGPGTDESVVQQIRDAIAGERACNVTLLNYRKDGTPFWNELALSPVHDANGRLTHFVGVQNDVTRRTEAEHERDVLLEQQQRIVQTLQKALLLTPPPAFDGLEVVTQYEPAWDEAQFGGDFYDVFPLDERRVALVCGDVTGKGLKAAQYTAEVKYGLRILLREQPNDPTPTLERLNQFLMDAQRLDNRDEGALVCIALSIMDTITGRGLVATAGMEPPLIVRASGETYSVEAFGPLLGMDMQARYALETIQLGIGDTLLLTTDGITEARSATRTFFGYDGLTSTAREVLSVQASLPVHLETASEKIVEAAKEFAGGKPQDDVCLLLARRSVSSSKVAFDDINHLEIGDLTSVVAEAEAVSPNDTSPFAIVKLAFDRLPASPEELAEAYLRFHIEMATPARPYHNENHIETVLERILAWTENEPSVSLVAAAIYHDVIYDAYRSDNELLSAVYCHTELERLGLSTSDLVQATHLILMTRFHRVSAKDSDAVLLVDADLHVLGSSPKSYDAYVAAIREEYRHVSDEDWRSGRKAVLLEFLNRERIYIGAWDGIGVREAQARANIAGEIAEIASLDANAGVA